MKKCTMCHKDQDVGNFYADSISDNGLQARCKSCASIIRSAYVKTKGGLTSRIYGKQRECSRKRGHQDPDYTLKELRTWMYAQPNFEELFDNWVQSGYNKFKRPSVDRLDDNIGYSFNNIQLVTWLENDRKYRDRNKDI